MFVETDSPYLTPVPHRGKRNEPAYVRFVAETVANVKKLDLEEVAQVTTDNVKSLLRI
jgi:TatD DNase family protein